MIHFADTICAPATSVGSGAISVIRVSGPDALSVADKVVCCKNGSILYAPGYSVKFGTVLLHDGSVLDDVLATVFRAPHSYTGEDSVEISCHASPFIVSELISGLCASGCRMANPGEFTRRAFVAGKMDLAQAEAVADVIGATSEAEHRVAMSQLRGGYSAELQQVRAKLLELSALLELELDFSEEEVEFADRSKLRTLASEAAQRCSSLAASFKAGNAIKNGIPVAIVGAPNSGKSTLLNALLQDDRAIVSDIPGTTRDTVEEVCVIGGIKFRFIDTAGLRETSDVVESLGIERSFAAIGKASVVLGVVDFSSPAAGDDLSVIVKAFEERTDGSAKLIAVMNKIDCCTDPVSLAGIAGIESLSGANQPILHPGSTFAGIAGANQAFLHPVSISALKGEGLDNLKEELAKAAGPVDGSQTLVTNARHAAALDSAAASLQAVISGLATSLPGDLIAEDLRAALSFLGEITGEISTDEVLGEIFGKFCIGK